MKRKQTENKIVLSQKVKLPKYLTFYLHNLFEINKTLVNLELQKLWNEEGFEKVKSNKKAYKTLEPVFERPSSVPSRIFRNSLELSGRIIRSQIERKELFELIYSKPCLVFWSEFKIKKHFKLSHSPLFIHNVQRQVKNLIKKGKKVNSYFELKRPEFKGNVVLTDADDGVEKGQFKKLRVSEEKIELKVKVPEGREWIWKEVEFETPERIKKLLEKGYKVRAPIFLREKTHRGEEYYLGLVFEKGIKEGEERIPDRVLSIDLSPSMRRLGVGCVVERSGKVSRPIYFKAEEAVRKIVRIRKEISNLRRRIDRLRNEKEKTEKEGVKEELQEKIGHLYKEKKVRERKIRNLRKEVVEIFVNEILVIAKVLGISVVVIEDLSFKEAPEWGDKTLRWLFSTWFYARFRKRLKEKAKKEGIRVEEENPSGTSSKCFCGREVKKEGHYLVCEVHKKYDRDYIGAINLGKRYLKPLTLEVGGSPETVPSGGISSPIPTPIKLTTLLAYLKLVKCTYLNSLIPKLQTQILNTILLQC